MRVEQGREYSFTFFNVKEFACNCCAKNEMMLAFIGKVNRARERAGVPFRITSGYRCLPHNIKVRGATNSAHREGVACDIACDNSRDRFIIIKALIEVGFTRIGIHKEFIHVDDDDRKPKELVWLY